MSTLNTKLGNLERVELESIWPNEQAESRVAELRNVCVGIVGA